MAIAREKQSMQYFNRDIPVHRIFYLFPFSCEMLKTLVIESGTDMFSNFTNYRLEISVYCLFTHNEMLIRTSETNTNSAQSCPRVGWTRGSGRVGSRFCRISAGRVGSGQHFGNFSFLLIISGFLNQCESSNTAFGFMVFLRYLVFVIIEQLINDYIINLKVILWGVSTPQRPKNCDNSKTTADKNLKFFDFYYMTVL